VQPLRNRREGELEILLRSLSTPTLQIWMAKTTVVSGHQEDVITLGSSDHLSTGRQDHGCHTLLRSYTKLGLSGDVSIVAFLMPWSFQLN